MLIFGLILRWICSFFFKLRWSKIIYIYIQNIRKVHCRMLTIATFFKLFVVFYLCFFFFFFFNKKFYTSFVEIENLIVAWGGFHITFYTTATAAYDLFSFFIFVRGLMLDMILEIWYTHEANTLRACLSFDRLICFGSAIERWVLIIGEGKEWKSERMW